MPVTVVIPTHNRPNLLRGAIESAATQTEPPKEIVIADNAVDPLTFEVVLEAQKTYDVPITYIRQKHPVGFWDNWKTGIDQVQTEWVKILPDDDRLHAECLEKHLAMSSGKTIVQCAAAMNGQIVYGHKVTGPFEVAAAVQNGLMSANPVTSLIKTKAVRDGWKMFNQLSQSAIDSLCGPNLLIMYGVVISDWSQYANTPEVLVTIDGFTGEGDQRSYTLRLMESNPRLWQESYQEAYKLLNELAGSANNGNN
jgi:glycosyltransferase involved in cell wall biosynthesis